MAKRDEEYEFNPVKEQVGGKEAERVVWSTSVLNKAVEAIGKGMPLKANPFIGKNTKLLRPNLLYKRTQEEMEDYIKCKMDPVYFATKCFLMTPEGLKACTLRDYQEDYLRHLQNNRFSIWLACRQAGKSLNLQSKIKIKLKKCLQVKNFIYYYIKDDIYEVPIFELINLYNKSFIWKLKYPLYKLIYKIENICQVKRDNN